MALNIFQLLFGSLVLVALAVSAASQINEKAEGRRYCGCAPGYDLLDQH
jgi:hypothetical protein